MSKPKSPQRYLVAGCALVLACLLPLAGCTSAETREKHRAQMTNQRDKYSQLLLDLQGKSLEKGMEQALVKKKYGEPSSIFRSGTTEIWIFRDVNEDNTENNNTPIRLYFENNKLLVWNY